MKAIGYRHSLPVSDEASPEDIRLPALAGADLGPRDLLVEVAAVPVNPVDPKVRMRVEPEGATRCWAGTPRASWSRSAPT